MEWTQGQWPIHQGRLQLHRLCKAAEMRGETKGSACQVFWTKSGDPSWKYCELWLNKVVNGSKTTIQLKRHLRRPHHLHRCQKRHDSHCQTVTTLSHILWVCLSSIRAQAHTMSAMQHKNKQLHWLGSNQAHPNQQNSCSPKLILMRLVSGLGNGWRLKPSNPQLVWRRHKTWGKMWITLKRDKKTHLEWRNKAISLFIPPQPCPLYVLHNLMCLHMSNTHIKVLLTHHVDLQHPFHVLRHLYTHIHRIVCKLTRIYVLEPLLNNCHSCVTHPRWFHWKHHIMHSHLLQWSTHNQCWLWLMKCQSQRWQEVSQSLHLMLLLQYYWGHPSIAQKCFIT